MTATLAFNPMAVTNGLNMFNTESIGFTQGDYQVNPTSRTKLQAGQLASAETVPMWGGRPVKLYVPSTSGAAAGGSVASATVVADILGFTTFSQANGMVQSAQSPVPLAGSYMTVNYFELGSGVLLAVKADPSLAVALEGGLINTQVSWDFNNQCLQTYDAATATVSVTSITSTYSNGVYTFAVVAAAPTLVGAVGDMINVSGVTGTGASLVNTNQTITSFTDNEHFSFQITAASGAIATGALAGIIILNQGIGALNVKVKNINVGNSMVVNYDTNTGLATWVRNGTCALIEL